METPTITMKQAKNTLSGKKKKIEVIKNLLVKPYDNYWPLLSLEDNKHLKETLMKFLPKIKQPKVNIAYEQIKSIPKNERKKFRSNLEQSGVINESDRKTLVFGINDVTQLLEKQEMDSILVASDVQPRLLVQHILDQSVLYKVPILIVNDLRIICKSVCGINGVVVGLKKPIISDSKLGVIQQTIHNIYENYPVCENHMNYHRKIDINTITIIDSEDGQSANDCDEKKEKINYQLKRKVNGERVFVPKKSSEVKLKSYVNLEDNNQSNAQSQRIVNQIQRPYHSLKVKRVKGNKNRQKQKLQKIKRKK